MPAVTRKGDSCSGHGDFPPRPSTGGSSTVFVNGKPVHRQGDAWAVHCNPLNVCHGGSLSAGSGTVFVEGKEIGRIGDPVGCGSSVTSGSDDVFAGG